MGPNINPHAIRMLALLNENRGRASAGFFNGKQHWVKVDKSISSWLKDKDLRKWLERSVDTGVICGHTRAPSRGEVKVDNAHPFEYGEIVGSHNGTIDAPFKYDVDSMYMFDLLSQHEPGEYQKALGDVEGWYVLTWRDNRTGDVYFLNWTGSLHATQVGHTWYYSSQADHLEIALGLPSTHVLKHGEVWKWDRATLKMLRLTAGFTGKERTYQKGGKGGVNVRCYGGHDPDEAAEYVAARGGEDRYDHWNDSNNFTGECRIDENGVWWGRKYPYIPERWTQLACQEECRKEWPKATPGEKFTYGRHSMPWWRLTKWHEEALKAKDKLFERKDDDTVIELPNETLPQTGKIVTDGKITEPTDATKELITINGMSTAQWADHLAKACSDKAKADAEKAERRKKLKALEDAAEMQAGIDIFETRHDAEARKKKRNERREFFLALQFTEDAAEQLLADEGWYDIINMPPGDTVPQMIP